MGHFEKNDLMIDPHAFPSASQPLPAATPHHPPRRGLIAPAALVLAALLVAAPSARAAQTDIPGPAGSGTFGKAVTYLPNGNFVVTDPTYSLTTPTAVASVGAVYLYNGSTLALISTLTGSAASDQVGNGGVTVLSNGNFVVRSQSCDNGAVNSAGAVTWGSATAGVSGTVSSANSLVGSTAFDQVGESAVTALSNGNYVVVSPSWTVGAISGVGAVTWGNGTVGTVGAVSAANSLVGSKANDQVGLSGVTALSNGNYVVRSARWDMGSVAEAGAVTWGNGSGGTVGTVSAANSVVGSTANDNVGGAGVTALSNGNYVVPNPIWDNGAVTSAGAVTWGNGTGGTVGAVSSTNSLVGSNTSDGVGHSVTALSNGNYVVCSKEWKNGAVASAGAVTWGNGTTGTVGTVSTANSLVGSKADDLVGIGGVTALNNGNYVVCSWAWNTVGAATWANGTTGIVGTISAANSLVGSTAGDLYNNAVTALSNGNYVVRSPSWDNGAVTNAGAATWGNGTTGTVGTVSAENSLVGSVASDGVGTPGVTALSNGNYVVNSRNWDNGVVSDAGASTWANGTTGLTGAVSAVNSLVGSKSSDFVGQHLAIALTNGNYVVRNPSWDNGAVADVGAATWGDGTTGLIGTVSAANSLVGSVASDSVGNNNVVALSDGNYVVYSTLWKNGALASAGAVTLSRGTGGTVGTISTANSVLGTVANGSTGLAFSYDASSGNLLVGQPSAKQVTVLDRRPTVTGAPTDTTVDHGTSATFTASATGDPAPTLRWQVSGNGGVDWTDVDGATASPYTFTASTADTGKKYRVVFTNAAGSATSTAATLTVTLPQLVISTWPGATAITYGQTLASSTLSGGVASAEGTFAFTTPSTTPAVGTADQAVTFTPTDAVNYSPVSGTASVTVQQATPTVTTWPSATSITYGQTLGSSTLSGGEASVAGTFAFTSPGTVPATGTANQGVTFTPTDAVNYTTVSGTVSVKVNAAPVFAGYTVTLKTGKVLAIAPAKILARASDPDGGAVTLTRAFGPSAQGGTVSLTGTVNYTPPASFIGTDSFEIELTGSQGGTLRATVTVTVTADASAGLNQTEIRLRDGMVDLTFRGIPGRSYTVQRSTNLLTWTTLATVTAAADGRITFTDPSPPQPSGYYRAQ
jgi:hypothetical protein